MVTLLITYHGMLISELSFSAVFSWFVFEANEVRLSPWHE